MTRPPVDYPTAIAERYTALGYGVYQWVQDDSTPPWAPITKPLSECRVALISSGGAYLLGQTAFHFRDDLSTRDIPFDADRKDLRVTHFAYDLTDARSDHNSVLPLDSLGSLVGSTIESTTANAISFVGGIYSARRVREVLAPRIVEMVTAMQADLALLVPV